MPVDPQPPTEETTPEPHHTPVLVNEARNLLAPEPGGIYVDATAGLGGHAAAIAPSLGPQGLVVLNDLDRANLERARRAVIQACDRAGAKPPAIELVHGNFAYLPAALRDRGILADMVLADLGFASSQMDDPTRGLSFSHEGPLDMRLDPEGPTTAADLVNTLPERDLADLLYRFGEERAARRIARKIVAARRDQPIHTTSRLASIVRAAVPHQPRSGARPGPARPRIDPATRTFQALRIAVNDEIGSLSALLREVERAAESLVAGSSARSWVRSNARLVIIAFHSLEDRPVKRTFLDLDQRGLALRLTRKPIRPSDDEILANPRARSARLRGVSIM